LPPFQIVIRFQQFSPKYFANIKTQHNSIADKRAKNILFNEHFEKGFLERFRSGFPYSWISAYAGMTGLGAHRHSRPVSSTGQAPAGIQCPFAPENHFCKGL